MNDYAAMHADMRHQAFGPGGLMEQRDEARAEVARLQAAVHELEQAVNDEQERYQDKDAEIARLRAALIYRPTAAAEAEVCRGCWLVGFNGEGIEHSPACWVVPLLADA